MNNLCVTVSGGETSMYAALWIRDNLKADCNVTFVFANTGEENEQTLEFVDKCARHYSLPIVWVEAVINPEVGKGTRHKIVNFETASRQGEPFYPLCKKYGLPNPNFFHCTRELKEAPIKSYCKSLGWESWYTSIGIRSDELDRVSPKYKEQQKYYPLAFDNPKTKPQINNFWASEPFRLQLKGYQGNCKTCYKKREKKLLAIAQESPEKFQTFKCLELLYSHVKPKDGEERRNMFYEEKTVDDILSKAKSIPIINVTDDSQVFDDQLDLFGCQESCEPFAN